MQSRSVVRGSTRSWRSLPLMRSVTGIAPAIFGPSALAAGEALCPEMACACAGAHTAMTAAAAVSPVVRRNARRLGFEGLDDGSFRIEPPFGCINHFLLYSELVSVSHFRKKPSVPPSRQARELAEGQKNAGF